MRLVRELLVADAEPAVVQADAAGRASRYLQVFVTGLGIRGGAVLLRAPDRGLACVASTVGAAATDLLVDADGRVGTLVRRTAEERRAFLVRRGTDDPLLALLREGDPAVGTVAIVPLVDRTTAGVLVLAGDETTLAPDVVRTLTPALRLLAILAAPHRDGVIPSAIPNGVLESVRAERDGHARTIHELAARVGELESALVAARELAIIAPDLPVTRDTVEGAALANVEATEALLAVVEHAADPSMLVVLDVAGDWERHAIPDLRVVTMAPAADVAGQLAVDPPARLVVNLAAAGGLAQLVALRQYGVKTPALGVLRAPDSERVVGLGLVEVVDAHASAEAMVEAVVRAAPRGARVFAAGRDAGALLKMRQALAKQGLSVSMARDTKQIEELVAMVRPQVMVVDLDLPAGEGYELVLRAAAMTPSPVLVVLLPEGDPLPALTKKLRDRIAAGVGMNAKQWLARAAAEPIVTKPVTRPRPVPALPRA